MCIPKSHARYSVLHTSVRKFQNIGLLMRAPLGFSSCRNQTKLYMQRLTAHITDGVTKAIEGLTFIVS